METLKLSLAFHSENPLQWTRKFVTRKVGRTWTNITILSRSPSLGTNFGPYITFYRGVVMKSREHMSSETIFLIFYFPRRSSTDRKGLRFLVWGVTPHEKTGSDSRDRLVKGLRILCWGSLLAK